MMGLNSEERSLKTEKILMMNGLRVATLDSLQVQNMDSYSKLFFIGQNDINCSIHANKERI